jgi:spore maturation protein CgeB
MDYSRMKVLYYDSEEINLNNIIWGLLQLGIDVARSELRVTLNTPKDEQISYIKSEIKKYTHVITQDFSVNVAIACHELDVPYISWIYDSPQIALYTDYALYDTNFVFAFDKVQVSRLREYGINHIYHMPLAANIAYTSAIKVTDDDIRKYRADISFVGQLYRHGYMSSFLLKLPDNIRNELMDKAEEKALKWYNGSNIFNSISDESASVIASLMEQSDFVYYHMDKKFSEEVLLLAPLIAQKERETILSLAGEKYRTSLYTTDRDLEYAQSNICGVKSYGKICDEIPYKVYYSTKLNLNITLRSIEAGAPQRVFDIMSVGGAVISNYQEELAELFEPDKEIILFESPEEFVEKTSYYLNHSSAREKIGIAGYTKVKENYDYPVALSKIFEAVDGEIK